MRANFELSDPSLRPLLVPVFGDGTDDFERAGGGLGGGGASIDRTGGSEGGVMIRLELVADLPPDSETLQERWTGASPIFEVRFGDQLEARVDAEAATIDGWVRPALLRSHPDTARRLLVEAPLAAILARNGWQVVHGATVVGAAGAVVIRGPADSGKSTLAAAAAAAGLRVLGDESVLVRRPGFTEVLAAVREVLVDPSIAAKLQLPGHPEETSAGEVKVRLALDPIAAAQRQAAHLATVLIGDRECPHGARLTPIDGEAFFDFFAAGEIPQESWYGSPEDLVRSWAERPAYRLDGAADLDSAVATLAALALGDLR